MFKGDSAHMQRKKFLVSMGGQADPSSVRRRGGGTIAHNFDFLNWRTCPPLSEDKSELSSNFLGQNRIVLQLQRTRQNCPPISEDRAKQPGIN